MGESDDARRGVDARSLERVPRIPVFELERTLREYAERLTRIEHELHELRTQLVRAPTG